MSGRCVSFGVFASSPSIKVILYEYGVRIVAITVFSTLKQHGSHYAYRIIESDMENGVGPTFFSRPLVVVEDLRIWKICMSDHIPTTHNVTQLQPVGIPQGLDVRLH